MKGTEVTVQCIAARDRVRGERAAVTIRGGKCIDQCEAIGRAGVPQIKEKQMTICFPVELIAKNRAI